MDISHVEGLVRELLLELGQDPTRTELVRTPSRFAEVLSSFELRRDAPPLDVTAEQTADSSGQMVLLRDVGFFSLCEHHLLPFFGRCQIGCVAGARAFDAKWCIDILSFFAHKPQLQERLTEQVADALFDGLQPEGVGVVAEGRHLCMMMRGVEKQNSDILTSTLRGSFLDPAIRRSFFAHVGRGALVGDEHQR